MRYGTILAVSVSTFVVLSFATPQEPPSPRTSTGPARARTQVDGPPASDRDHALDFPPLPNGTISLTGGTVVRLDPIHDRIVLRPFGGRDVTIDFDTRTKVTRDGTVTSTREIHPGTRLYADTLLVNGRVFAKTLRIQANPGTGEVQGRVSDYDATRGVLSVFEGLSAEPMRLRVDPATTIRRGDQALQPTRLEPGTLVRIDFRPGPDHLDIAQKIDVLAKPGNTFTFAGTITFVDLRTGYVGIIDYGQRNTYEVAIDRLSIGAKAQLKEGAGVVVQAIFDGRKYEAQTIEQAPAPVR